MSWVLPCVTGSKVGTELLVSRLVHEEDLGALQQNVQGRRKKNEQMPTNMFHLLLKNKRLESIEHMVPGYIVLAQHHKKEKC